MTNIFVLHCKISKLLCFLYLNSFKNISFIHLCSEKKDRNLNNSSRSLKASMQRSESTCSTNIPKKTLTCGRSGIVNFRWDRIEDRLELNYWLLGSDWLMIGQFQQPSIFIFISWKYIFVDRRGWVNIIPRSYLRNI